MIFYDYQSFETDVKDLARQIKDNYNPDVILAIARGGLTLAHFLSIALNTRNCFSLNSIHYEDTQKLDTINIFNIPDLSKFNKILIVDDIIDSGESMIAIKNKLCEIYPHLELKVATIYYKPKALLIPEFTIKEATDWIEFFWDIKI